MSDDLMQIIFVGQSSSRHRCMHCAADKRLSTFGAFPVAAPSTLWQRAASACVPQEMIRARPGSLKLPPTMPFTHFTKSPRDAARSPSVAWMNGPARNIACRTYQTSPSLSACTQILLYRPGTMSFLMRNSGM